MSPLTIAAHTAAVAAIAALVWTIIGRPRRSRSPAVQAVALTGPTITAILHKGENLDANLTGATNPDIILWIASIIWWLIPLMLLMVATYPKPGHDTGWINAPIRILQEWTMGKALLMTVATAGLIMVPWLWHAIDPRYETPFLTTIQPWMAAGLLLTAAGISVHYARRKNETAEDAAVIRAGQIIYYAARGVGKVVDHTALAAYTIALTALVVATTLQQFTETSAHEVILRKTINYSITGGATATAVTLSRLTPAGSIRPRRTPTTAANYATIAALTAGAVSGQWWPLAGNITVMISAAIGATGAAMSIWWPKASTAGRTNPDSARRRSRV